MAATQAEMDQILDLMTESLKVLKDISKVGSATNVVQQLIYVGLHYSKGVKHFLINDLTAFDAAVKKHDEELNKVNADFKDVHYLFAVAIEMALKQFATEKHPLEK